ncbi:MAG: hypothetical protein IKB95_10285 [Bacteroidales bacterium]|nr:hypothetical protein [Bacteroidales bacterium]
MEEQKKQDNPNSRNPFAEHELSEEDRRLLIENYFKINHVEFPSLLSGHAILTYIGAFLGLVMIFYLKNAIPTVIVSLSCFVFAFWHFYRFIIPYLNTKKLFAMRPKEEQMIAWLIKDLKENVKPKSITTLGLNMSDVKPENFIIIPVPVYWETPGIDNSNICRQANSDGTYLFSIWRVQILVLTTHYISLFKCNYNWLNNTMSGISTNEFYFTDITSIRNDMREIEHNFIDNPEQPVGGGRVFNVANVSGENISVINEIPSLPGPKAVAVNLEYVITLLRMILRNRRFGITREVEPEKVEEKAPEVRPGQMQDPEQKNFEVKQRTFDIEQKGALYSDQQFGTDKDMEQIWKNAVKQS